jgi:hypothetical protein
LDKTVAPVDTKMDSHSEFYNKKIRVSDEIRSQFSIGQSVFLDWEKITSFSYLVDNKFRELSTNKIRPLNSAWRLLEIEKNELIHIQNLWEDYGITVGCISCDPYNGPIDRKLQNYITTQPLVSVKFREWEITEHVIPVRYLKIKKQVLSEELKRAIENAKICNAISQISLSSK